MWQPAKCPELPPYNSVATALRDGSVMSGTTVPAAVERGPAVTLRLARDDRLARMAAAGDSRAFAVIYERYHQPIYRYCRSILGDPDDAADALQNAMLKAMRSLEGTERAIALKPWLFRIAHNEAISLVRRRRPTTALEDTEFGPLAHSADEDAATRERLTQLVDDLRQLPDRQRGALLMRELAGLGFDEIADVFDVSAAAAKQTVYEARTALHEYVDGRQMKCEDARRSLSAGDRRMLRGRKLSAHLRDCSSCRDFQELTRARTRDVAALAPPLSASAAAAILQGIVGAGAGGGAGGGGIVAWVTGSGAKALLGSQAAKSLLAAALVTASAGALEVVSGVDNPQTAAPSAGASLEARDASQQPDAMELRSIQPPAPAPEGGKRTASRPSAGHTRTAPSDTGGSRLDALIVTGNSTGSTGSHRSGDSQTTAPATSSPSLLTAPATPTETPSASLPTIVAPVATNVPSLPVTLPATLPPAAAYLTQPQGPTAP